MTPLKVWICTHNNKYFTTDIVECDKCDLLIEEGRSFIYQLIWNKGQHKSRVKAFCLRCMKNIQPEGIADEWLTVCRVYELPRSVRPVTPTPPSLVASSSLAEATNTLNCHVSDKTRVSRDPQRNIMPEYKTAKQIFNEEIKRLDAPVKDIDKAIEDVKESKPIVPKLLECDKDN